MQEKVLLSVVAAAAPFFPLLLKEREQFSSH